jgi:hypothetical protein
MACVVETSVFTRTYPVEVRILIENVSDQGTIELAERRPYLDYFVAVTRPDQQPVPLTERGRDLRESKALRDMASRKLVSIPPRRSYAFPYPLHEFFDLSRPGDYEVTVSRPDWKDGADILTAPACPFRVV